MVAQWDVGARLVFVAFEIGRQGAGRAKRNTPRLEIHGRVWGVGALHEK